ncbi:hypothetical protein [Rhizobium bangladeshense]|uniref:hypothetical protein n=1 Tax=Rhizobium bangladeshense TaxID=1138189 RepID=UPI001C906ACB|nr:hypothetical protein [Rhizobium bangladeshense]MBY3616133.1 hypothetical protein [Rhizobium bangladeshense]
MVKKTDNREEWGAVQLRAARDEELDCLDFRVLIIIAGRDRFSGNGRGCTMSPKQIALEVKAHEKSVSRSIGKLINRAYVQAEKRADRRLREYFVKYDGVDPQGSVTGQATNAENSVTRQVPILSEIGNIEKSNFIQIHTLPEDNKSCETLRDKRSCETVKHPPEGAASKDDATMTLSEAIAYFPNAPSFGDRYGNVNVGGFLAWFDRRMRSGQCTSDEVNAGLEIAEMVFDSYDNGTPEYGVAYRIIQTEPMGQMEMGYDG